MFVVYIEEQGSMYLLYTVTGALFVALEFKSIGDAEDFALSHGYQALVAV